MSVTVSRFVLAASLLLIGAFAKADEPERRHSFKVAIAARMEMDVQGKKQIVDADTELRYTWAQSGKKRTLSFDSAQVKSSVDGKPSMDCFMSRAKFTNTENGATKDVPFDKALGALKQMLQDSFDAAVCKIEIDDNGKVVKRTVVAGPGAKELIEQGMIANAMLFHPPFARTQNEWSAPAEISMGNGGFVTGDLSYKKIRKVDGEQAVTVSGTLTRDSFQLGNSPMTVKNAQYVVSGEQTYDTNQAEWTSGKLNIDVSFDMLNGDTPFASAKGKMTVKFEALPGKK